MADVRLMNVLHVTPYYAPAWAYGGVVRAVHGLAQAQSARGHRVTVLTTDALDRNRRLPSGPTEEMGIRVIRVSNLVQWLRANLNLSTPGGFGRAARSILTDHNIDLVHCHELRTMENALVAGPAAEARLPMIMSPHGTLPYATGRPWAKRFWDRAIGRRLLAQIAHFVALTPEEAGQIQVHCARWQIRLTSRQISVVPNGIEPAHQWSRADIDSFRVKWNLGDGPVLVFVGRLTERKGLLPLLEAVGGLCPGRPDLRLLMVGPEEGLLPEIRRRVARAGLSQQVVLTGLLPPDEVELALQVADLFILPATGEGFSLAVLEALAAGLPVVISPGCQFALVAERGAGLVVEPLPASLQAAIADLLVDRQRRQRMSRGAKELAAEFGWPAIAAKLDAVYQAQLAAGGAE
jgi:glycosyltransferase involved in cell wall biosynthesis